MRLWSVLKLAILLLLAATFGFLIQQDSGLIVVAWNGVSLTTNLWLGLLLLLLGLGLLSLMARLLRSKRHWQHWQDKRQRLKQQQAQQWLQEGIVLLLNDRFAAALKKLQRSRAASTQGWLPLLLEAHCLKQLKQPEQAFARLQQGVDTGDGLALLFAWQQVELLRQDQPERALAMSQQLRQQQPDSPLLQKQSLQLNLQLRDHRAAIALLPSLLAQQGPVKEQLLHKVSQALIDGRLQLPELNDQEQQSLADLALQIPKDDAPLTIIHGLALALIGQGQQQPAAALLARTLKKRFTSPLVALYGGLPLAGNEQQRLLQKLLSAHESDGELQLAMARVLMRQSAWQDAREFLDRALALGASQAKLELLRWAQAQQDQALANELSQELVQAQLARLPSLTA